MCDSRVRCVVAGALLSLVASAPLQAQEVARTFDQWQVLLRPGETVKISDPTAREITVKVERLSPLSLTVLSDGSRRELQAADIVNIRQRRPDSLWNGAMIGFAGGIAFPALTIGLDFDGDAGAFWATYSICGLVGAGVGVGVDALVRGWRVTYATPKPTPSSSIAVAPLVARGRKGVMLSWRF